MMTMFWSHVPFDELAEKLERGETVRILMTGGDIRLPGPLGYEWVLTASVGEVLLEHASTVTTDNVREEE